jgi:hypothetical protein
MNAIELHERITENKDWAALLFVVCLGIVTVNKSISWVRFSEFIRLAYSDKYNKIYRDSSNLKDGFTVSMFFLQLISFSTIWSPREKLVHSIYSSFYFFECFHLIKILDRENYSNSL